MNQQRKFSIDPPALAKLEILCDKVLRLVNDFKHRIAKNAASSEQPQAYEHELRRYINKQRDQRLYIGVVRAMDHKLNEPRDFRVYLSASTGAGGYFDDYLDVEFLEYIKMLADERGVEAAARKHRLKKIIVQYAQETPVKDLRDLRGRGDIVLSIDEITQANPRPRIMDLLTHELTHGIQTLAPIDLKYNQVISKIHRGENLSRSERHIYYRERTEFEAQLNGMLAKMRAKYNDINNRDTAFEKVMQQMNPDDITDKQIDDYIQNEKQRYREVYRINLLELPRKTAQEVDRDINKIERRFAELQGDIKRNGAQIDMLDDQLDDIIAQAEYAKHECKRGDESSCNRLKELKPIYNRLSAERDNLYELNVKLHATNQELQAKYYVFGSTSRDFITSISGNQKLWDEFKQAIREFINSLD